MPAFRRLEVWSTLQCAGGVRQLVVTDLLALTETRSIIGEESLSATVKFSAGLLAVLAEWKVLRVVFDDDSFDEWRVADIAEGRGQDGASLVEVRALWPTVDLASLGIITRTETDGLVRPDFEVIGLSPGEHLTSFILPALTAAGATWFAAGTVTPTMPVDVVYAWTTPKEAVDLLAAQTGYEFQLRRNGTTNYLIDLVATIGGSAATVLFRTARNLTGIKRQRSAVELVSRVYPRGTNEDGVAATMARARWKVTAVDTTNDDVTLADPVGGDGPIRFDDQLNGKYLRRVSGTLDQILDSFAATQKVRVADASFYAVNDVVELRATSGGADLVSLDSPAAVALYGAPKVAVIDRPDIPATVNLCPNPAQRAWAGASSVPADSWAKVGSCTVTKTTTASRWRTGNQSTRVETAADGVGLEVAYATVAPTAASPYFSGAIDFWVTAGAVRIELVVTDGVTTWVIPNGTEGKTSNRDDTGQPVTGRWLELGVAGIDLKGLGTGVTSAKLRIVQDGAGTADFYVDAAQITQSAGQQPLIEGAGGTRLWQEGNRILEQQGTPSVRYDVEILDLNRLAPGTWPEDALVLGQTVAVYDSELNIIGNTRALEYTRDLLVNADTRAVLSNRPEDLTDELTRRPRARRLTRDSILGNPPVITPYYSRINGTPFQALVTLQATPPGCTIYKWVGLSSDTVPVAGSASYSVYASPITVNLAASATYNGVVACYAVLGGRQSPVSVFQLPLSPEPLAPVSLSEPVGGTLRITWSPNAWVRRVRVYRRQHATSWPTGDGTTTGVLDNAYFVAEMNVQADGGGFDVAGAPIPGGTLLENTGWTNGQVARVIVVPIDELDNIGARATANLTMTGAAAAALTAASHSFSSDGSNCGSGSVRNFAWTPNGSVVDGTHDLKVYVAVDGGAPTLLFTETSPASVTTRNTVTIPSVDGVSSYNAGSGTTHTFTFTYELIATAGPTVVDSGSVAGLLKPKNSCV